MLVYRIEHKDNNIGPYWNDDTYRLKNPAIRDIGYKHTNENHPSMWNDVDRNTVTAFLDQYHCAFNSIDQCVAWFDGWFEILHENDYILAIYDTNDYGIGTYQTVFNKSTAIRLKELSICTLLEGNVYDSPNY